MMLDFPLLTKPESPAAQEKAGALMESATPLTYFLLALPAGPDRDEAVAGLSRAVLYAHQAICRESLPPKLIVAGNVPL